MKRPAIAKSPAAARLRTAMQQGRSFHACILEGPHDDTGELAEWFAAASLCSSGSGDPCGTCVSCRQIRDGMSPYIFRIRTEEEAEQDPFEVMQQKLQTGQKKAAKKSASGKSGKIRDRQIEEVISQSLRGSLTGERVITIIDRADTITERGQDRLLKTLEEPPEGVSFLLLCENAEALLETIRSRCQRIRVRDDALRLPDAGGGFRKRAVETAAAMISGAAAYELWKDIDYFAGSRERASDFALTAQVFYRDMMLSRIGGCDELIVMTESIDQIRGACRRSRPGAEAEAARSCEYALRSLRALVSAKHALRHLMFEIQLNRRSRDK